MQKTSRLRLFLPLAALLVMALAWCSYWYIASEKAKQSFAKNIEKNRAAGIEITCEQPLWGGFPYRFTLKCDRLVISGRKKVANFDISTGTFTAVAMAYNPRHLIGEIQSPITVALTGRDGGDVAIAATGQPVRMSVVGKSKPKRPDQISLQFDSMKGTVTETHKTNASIEIVPFEIGHLNVHTRYAAVPADGRAPFDVAVITRNLSYGPDTRSPLLIKEALEVDEGTFSAHITAVPLETRPNFSTWARDWHDGGGRLTVHDLKVASNFFTGSSRGDLELDRKGRLNGTLEGSVSGFDDLLERLETADILKKKEAAVADTIMTLLGKSDKSDTAPGLKVKTILKKGKLYFGPFKLTNIPPLF